MDTNKINWYKELFCDSNGKVSMKRVAGGIGWLVVSLILVAIAIKTGNEPSSLNEYMYTSATLIGLGTVMKTLNNSKS